MAAPTPKGFLNSGVVDLTEKYGGGNVTDEGVSYTPPENLNNTTFNKIASKGYPQPQTPIALDKIGTSAGESLSVYKDVGTTDPVEGSREWWNKFYDDQKNMLMELYGGTQDKLDAEKRNSQQMASITYDKLKKYLPMQVKAQGLGGLGVSESTMLQAHNNYVNQMGQIGSDYSSKTADLEAKRTSALGELENYRTSKLDEIQTNEWQAAYDNALTSIDNSGIFDPELMKLFTEQFRGKVSDSQFNALLARGEAVATANKQARDDAAAADEKAKTEESTKTYNALCVDLQNPNYYGNYTEAGIRALGAQYGWTEDQIQGAVDIWNGTKANVEGELEEEEASQYGAKAYISGIQNGKFDGGSREALYEECLIQRNEGYMTDDDILKVMQAYDYRTLFKEGFISADLFYGLLNGNEDSIKEWENKLSFFEIIFRPLGLKEPLTLEKLAAIARAAAEQG